MKSLAVHPLPPCGGGPGWGVKPGAAGHPSAPGDHLHDPNTTDMASIDIMHPGRGQGEGERVWLVFPRRRRVPARPNLLALTRSAAPRHPPGFAVRVAYAAPLAPRSILTPKGEGNFGAFASVDALLRQPFETVIQRVDTWQRILISVSSLFLQPGPAVGGIIKLFTYQQITLVFS